MNLNNFKVNRHSSLLYHLIWRLTSILLFSDICFSYSVRRSVLRLFGAKIGKNVIIRSGTYIYDPSLLEIEDFSWIGDKCHINNPVKLYIGKNVAIAHEVFIACGSHDFNDPNFATKHKVVKIHDNCWIASRAFISPGVDISNSIVLPCVLVPNGKFENVIISNDNKIKVKERNEF
jgi:putative colanic acid biosynthesis acetyltransferase WcaF